jgi:hypothetical protein
LPKLTNRQKKQRFLNAIERGMSVTAAARHAQVDRTTPYRWEREDSVFRHDWNETRLARIQRLRDVAFDVALEGDAQMIRFLLKRYELPDEAGPSQEGEVQITIITQQEDENGSPKPFIEAN